MGTLRGLPSLKPIVEKRFPNSKVFLGELFLSNDGKLRYLKHIRQKMIRCVETEIKKYAPKLSTYICMEKNKVWKNTMPFIPKNRIELEEQISLNLKKIEKI